MTARRYPGAGFSTSLLHRIDPFATFGICCCKPLGRKIASTALRYAAHRNATKFLDLKTMTDIFPAIAILVLVLLFAAEIEWIMRRGGK